MPPVTLAECKKKNGNIGIQVNDNMVCATKPGTQISGCHGDSGGPYVCKTPAGRWVLQGDVSWGSGSCDINQLYTVFGRVAKFRNWIDMHTNGGMQKMVKQWSILLMIILLKTIKGTKRKTKNRPAHKLLTRNLSQGFFKVS